MDNKTNKPKLTSHQLVKKMEIEKGIQFKYTSEAEAENYLSNINNYLRTAAYRKNFQYYRNGPNIGKYIHLDFAGIINYRYAFSFSDFKNVFRY